MFRSSKLLIAILLVCGLLVASCGTKDLTKGKTAQEIVEEAQKKMAEVNNYDMNIEMQMKMTPPGEEAVDMNVKGTGTIFQKPMRMKMSMEMNDPESGETITIQQYMEQTDTGMVVYQSVKGQWFKMVFNDPAFAEMMNMDPTKNVKLFIENLKEVNILGEEKIGEKETVKIEVAASSEMYEKIMQELPGMNLNAGQMPFDLGILSKIGDIKCVFWVDKTNLDIIKTAMDMTENMHNLGKALAESGNLPKEATEIFSSMEMSMEYEILNQNTAEEFTIPEEARNAQEIPMNGNMQQ